MYLVSCWVVLDLQQKHPRCTRNKRGMNPNGFFHTFRDRDAFFPLSSSTRCWKTILIRTTVIRTMVVSSKTCWDLMTRYVGIYEIVPERQWTRMGTLSLGSHLFFINSYLFISIFAFRATEGTKGALKTSRMRLPIPLYKPSLKNFRSLNWIVLLCIREPINPSSWLGSYIAVMESVSRLRSFVHHTR